MLRLKAHFDGFVQQKLNGQISCLEFTLLFQRKAFSCFHALFQTINYERSNNELINQLNRTKYSFPAYSWLVWVWTFMAKRWCLQIFNRSSTEEHRKSFLAFARFLVLRANLFFPFWLFSVPLMRSKDRPKFCPYFFFLNRGTNGGT